MLVWPAKFFIISLAVLAMESSDGPAELLFGRWECFTCAYNFVVETNTQGRSRSGSADALNTFISINQMNSKRVGQIENVVNHSSTSNILRLATIVSFAVYRTSPPTKI